MMDRLVCADGATRIRPALMARTPSAPRDELEGWDYPRHLPDGIRRRRPWDAEVPRMCGVPFDWLSSMNSAPPDRLGELDVIIGYWKPYATGHAALDAIRPCRRRCATPPRSGGRREGEPRRQQVEPGEGLVPPRQKRAFTPNQPMCRSG